VGRADHRVLLASNVPRSALPPEATEPPVLFSWWQSLCFAAFWDLNTERDCGWSLGPIPWTAIHTWGRSRGLRGDTLITFEYLIRRLDNAYVRIEGARLKQEAEAKEARHGR
jgi:hypothetical protein